MQLIFLLYVFGFQAAIFNVLTGIIVEKAVQAARPTEDEEMLHRRQTELADADELRTFCRKLDTDENGTISLIEFMSHMQHREFSDFFALRGLNIDSASKFFSMLKKVNGKEELDYNAFISACMKLRGEASKLDLQILTFQTSLMQSSDHRFHKYVEDRFAELTEYITLGTVPGTNADRTKSMKY